MSWSISVIGVPEKVSAQLDSYGETLSGQSKAEFDEAKPHLQGLIAQNVGTATLVKIVAAGHATIENGQKKYSNCNVSIEPFYATLAL